MSTSLESANATGDSPPVSAAITCSARREPGSFIGDAPIHHGQDGSPSPATTSGTP